MTDIGIKYEGNPAMGAVDGALFRHLFRILIFLTIGIRYLEQREFDEHRDQPALPERGLGGGGFDPDGRRSGGFPNGVLYGDVRRQYLATASSLYQKGR